MQPLVKLLLSPVSLCEAFAAVEPVDDGAVDVAELHE
jgi:hypothetical protein